MWATREEIDRLPEVAVSDVAFAVRFGVRLIDLLRDPDIGPGCDHSVIAHPLPVLDVFRNLGCLVLGDWFEKLLGQEKEMYLTSSSGFSSN